MTFALAIKCMDGRSQLPVIEYLKENYDVKYIDLVTEAGPVQHLADQQDSQTTRSILERAAISVEKHHSTLIAISAHHDCAGNAVCEKIQKRQIADSVDFIKKQFKNCDTIGLWVDQNWNVEKIA